MFLIVVLLFVYPLINQLINKHIQKQDLKISSGEARPVDPYYTVLSLSSKAFFKDDIGKIWSLIDDINIDHADSSFITVGENSRLVLRTIDGLELALAPNSMLKITKEGKLIKIKMNYGCFGLRKAHLDHENIELLGEKYSEEIVNLTKLNKNFCYYKDRDTVEESKIDLFEEPYSIVSNFPQLEIMEPCDEVIEVDDEGSRYAGIELVFLSPPFTENNVLVSTNEAFTDNVFSTKTRKAEKIKFKLPRGKYFWKVRATDEDEFSKACGFEVVHHEEILQKYPKNNSVFSTGSSIEFSWNDNLPATSYSIFINGEKLSGDAVPMKKVFRSNTKKLKLNNLSEVIGLGSFYWRVESNEGKISPLRKFRIISKEDVVIRYPKKDQIIDPKEKVFIVSWKPFNSVKGYELKLFKDEQLKRSIYSHLVSAPFDLLDSPGSGEYYLVLDLIFDNDERMSSGPLRFFIDKSEEIEVISPVNGAVSSVASTGLKNLLWKPIDDVLMYRVFVNDDKPFELIANESLIKVKQGLNKVAIYAFCRNTGNTKPCAIVTNHVFKISSIIEAPNSPIIKYPFNRNIFKGGNVTIELSRLKDVSGYKVEMSEDIDFEEIKEFESISSKFNFNSEKGIYYWRAYSFIDIDGERIYSRPTETRILIVR